MGATMGSMMNPQLLTLLIAVLGGQFGVAYYLARRIDRSSGDLSGHIDSMEKRIH